MAAATASQKKAAICAMLGHFPRSMPRPEFSASSSSPRPLSTAELPEARSRSGTGCSGGSRLSGLYTRTGTARRSPTSAQRQQEMFAGARLNKYRNTSTMSTSQLAEKLMFTR